MSTKDRNKKVTYPELKEDKATFGFQLIINQLK